MGGFTLWRHQLDFPKGPCSRNEAERPYRQHRCLQSGAWKIAVADKAIGHSSASYVLDDNNFAISAGTFVYRGMKGDAAIVAAFLDFDQMRDFWQEAYGCFCLVICKRGLLRLMPDRLGVYPLFCDSTQSIVSSSFLTVLETIERPTINRQAVYEYVFQGASYGRRTVINEVQALERGYTFRLDKEFDAEVNVAAGWDGPEWTGFDNHLNLTVSSLRREFRALSQAFGDTIDTALSGGYDSRLVLSLLRDQGVSPRVHVYGAACDPDVLIAKKISSGEGFQLVHSDKSLEPLPSPDRFSEIVAENFFIFDGYPSDGIIDAGADACTRLERAAGKALALNGGGGEIFRNFFYLPDRPFTIRDVISGFFSQFDPIMCTDQFDEAAYVQELALTIAKVLKLDIPAERVETKILSRGQIEYLYPFLRCVYWMGRNNGVNNRIGFATTPFIEPSLIGLALKIPIRFKNHGIFEAALINMIDPKLADYPSSYGCSFSEPVTFARKLKDYSTIFRPPSLRRFTYRIQNRRRVRDLPTLLKDEFLKKVIDPTFPILRRYFNIDEVRSSLELNRICTLEYLFEKCGVSEGTLVSASRSSSL